MPGAGGPNSSADDGQVKLHEVPQPLQQRLQGLQQPVMPIAHRLKARNSRIVFMAHLPSLEDQIKRSRRGDGFEIAWGSSSLAAFSPSTI